MEIRDGSGTPYTVRVDDSGRINLRYPYEVDAILSNGAKLGVDMYSINNIVEKYNTIMSIESLPNFEKWDYNGEYDVIREIKDEFTKHKLTNFLDD